MCFARSRCIRKNTNSIKLAFKLLSHSASISPGRWRLSSAKIGVARTPSSPARCTRRMTSRTVNQRSKNFGTSVFRAIPTGRHGWYFDVSGGSHAGRREECFICQDDMFICGDFRFLRNDNNFTERNRLLAKFGRKLMDFLLPNFRKDFSDFD